MRTSKAKPSPLGEPYHYHETGYGSDINTTDSAIDDGPHDHGFATGLGTSLPTTKNHGSEHDHYIDLPARKAITGIGNGGKVLVLQDQMRAAAKLISSLTSELHNSAVYHGNKNHDGTSFRKCKSWHCADARKMLDELGTLAPTRNPFALRGYRQRLQRLQKAIKTSAPDLPDVP